MSDLLSRNPFTTFRNFIVALPESWSGKNPHGATVGELYYPVRRVGCYARWTSPIGFYCDNELCHWATCRCSRNCGNNTTICGRSNCNASLATFYLCGVIEVYRVGGVQAIGALFLRHRNTSSVDKVFGPGNAYVMEAKRQVFGQVGVDLLPWS